MTGSRHSRYRFKLTLSSWKRSPRKYLAVERVLGSSSGASSVRSGHFLLSRRCESICSNQIGHKTCQFFFTFSSGLDNKVGLMPFRGTSKFLFCHQTTPTKKVKKIFYTKYVLPWLFCPCGEGCWLRWYRQCLRNIKKKLCIKEHFT